jgi:PAS domain S-box-containing protein
MAEIVTWRILLVDDDEDDFFLTRQMLKQSQYRKIILDWAPTYTSGVEQLISSRYDAVLVDYDLGSHTGVQLIREFEDKGYPAPFILYTGRGSYEIDLEAMQAGATLYLTKNEVSSLTLERFIRYAIEHKEVEERLRDSLEANRSQRELLQTIVDKAPIGIAVVEGEGLRVVEANPAFEAFNPGSSPAGRSLAELFPDAPDKNGYRFLLQQLHTGEHAFLEERPIQIRPGEPITWLNITHIPLRGARALVLTQDVTEQVNARQDLEAERAFLVAALQQMPAGVGIAGAPSGKTILANHLFEEVLGQPYVPLESVSEYDTYVGFHPDGTPYRAHEWPLARTVTKGEVVQDEEIEIIHADGERRTLKVSSAPIYDKDGTVIAGVVVASDITMRKQAERELVLKEEKLRYILNNITGPYVSLDVDWRYIEINEVAEQELFQGRPAGELIGKVIWEEFPQLVGDMAYHEFMRAMQTGEPAHFEQYSQILDRWYEFHAFPHNNCLEVYHRDISERKFAENALRESENRLQVALKTAPVLVYQMDKDLRYTWIHNPPAGMTLEEMIGKQDEELRPADEVAELVAFERSVLESGDGARRLVHFPTSNGSLVYDVTAEPVRSADGEISGLAVAAFDLTESLRMQEHLEYQAQLLENVHDAIIATDLDLRITSWNRAAEELYGWKEEEVIGKPVREVLRTLTTPDQRAVAIEEIHGAKAYKMDITQYTRDGRVIAVEGSTSPVYDSQERVIGYVSVNRDIGERKQAEQALAEANAILKESEGHLREVLNSLFTFVGLVTPDGTLVEANRAPLEAAGIKLEDVKGKPFDQAYWWSHSPEVQAEIRAAMQKAAQGQASRFDITARMAGSYLMPIDFMIAPMLDEHGRVKYLIPSAVDISERKQAEEAIQRYTRQLERSNQELEQFAFVASHDLREPLRKIEAFGKQLQERAEPVLGEREKDYLERMMKAAQRMNSMVEDLLALAGVTTRARPYAEVDLCQVAKTVLDDLEIQTKQVGGKIILEELPTVEADPVQMHQLFQNLISNALKFTRPGVRPRVHISCGPISGNQVEISISDNGIGFEKESLERILQPFQRLHSKSEYQGSGIGLTICQKILERHGGMITASSTPGEGATFTITLPLQQPDSKPASFASSEMPEDQR